jgi:hypothetical protein
VSDQNDAGGADLDAAERAVAALVEDVFVSLDAIAAHTCTVWDLYLDAGSKPRSGDLAVLQGTVLSELERQGGRFNGAGLVAAAGVLRDRPRHLQWWQRATKRTEGISPLHLDLNPSSEYFYDYTAMEWFVVPA